MSKNCGRCGETKNLELFRRQAKSKLGYNAWCMACHNAWMREQRKVGRYGYAGSLYKKVRYKGRIVAEHRMVLEKALGMRIPRELHVHHINGDKLDNRITNLAIATPKEHWAIHHTGVN